ncbi:MAG: hypothetical protein NWE91_04650 [Candidatus Bathyarchaeota archaeon]|nr:hypothetical protein [Candidatus Bathyarchaeota archaeon]
MSKLRTLREMLSSLKRRNPTRKHCPKCGNPYIHLSSKFDLWLLPEQYVCEKCGYKGSLTLEMEEEKQSK